MTREPHCHDRPSCLIVVPTLGERLAYLEQTLRSLQNQVLPVDIVVVAPVAATGARDLAQRFGARVLDDPGGLSASVNAALRTAAPWNRYGNWIGDDDLLAPVASGLAAAVLDRHQDVSLVYGHCTYMDGSGRPLFVSRAGRMAPAVLGWGPNLVPQPGMLFRIADFHAVGGLDESLRYAMDLDLLLRLKGRGRLVDLGVPVSMFRWHADSLTVSQRYASLAEAEAVKRRYLSRAGQHVSSLWERPVRLATHIAAKRIARKAASTATAHA